MFEESVHCQVLRRITGRSFHARGLATANDLSYMYEPYDKIITGNEREHYSLSLCGNR